MSKSQRRGKDRRKRTEERKETRRDAGDAGIFSRPFLRSFLRKSSSSQLFRRGFHRNCSRRGTDGGRFSMYRDWRTWTWSFPTWISCIKPHQFFFFWIYTAKEKKKMFRTEFFFRPLPELTPDIGVCKVATQER